MRGTDVTNIFNLPMDTAGLQSATVSYAYDGKVILRKEASSFLRRGITVELTPEETLLFPDDDFVRVQIVMVTDAGKTVKTRVKEMFSTELLDEEAITGDG